MLCIFRALPSLQDAFEAERASPLQVYSGG